MPVEKVALQKWEGVKIELTRARHRKPKRERASSVWSECK